MLFPAVWATFTLLVVLLAAVIVLAFLLFKMNRRVHSIESSPLVPEAAVKMDKRVRALEGKVDDVNAFLSVAQETLNSVQDTLLKCYGLLDDNRQAMSTGMANAAEQLAAIHGSLANRFLDAETAAAIDKHKPQTQPKSQVKEATPKAHKGRMANLKGNATAFLGLAKETNQAKSSRQTQEAKELADSAAYVNELTKTIMSSIAAQREELNNERQQILARRAQQNGTLHSATVEPVDHKAGHTVK